jgi:tight adherence protein C
MTGVVGTLLNLGGDNLMSALLVTLLLCAMIIAYLAAVPGNPLTVRLSSLRDRASGKMRPRDKKERFQFKFSLSTLKKLVEGLKLTRGEEAESTKDKLVKAGYRGREALVVYQGIRVVLPIGLVALLFIPATLFHLPIMQESMIGIVILAGGAYLPPMILKRITTARNRRFTKALPDVLDLLVICAEGGLSLDGALSRVSREFRRFLPEMADELGLTGIELGFLPSRRDALMNLAKRVDIPGMHSLVNTLVQTERYGTPLAQSLRALSNELRDERMLKAEEKAAKLPATMTVPMILFILPSVFIVLIGPAALSVYHTLHH